MKRNRLVIEKPKLILIRGIPGSGKSTLARDICNNPTHYTFTKQFEKFKHFESDMYHVEWGTGEYKYNPDRVKYAHDWCFNSTVTSLKHGYSVVVSNTFVKLWEMQKYLDAWDNNTVFLCTNNYGNMHNVPIDVIDRMTNTFEDYDEQIKIK